MHNYYLDSYAVHERNDRRLREAEAERLSRCARAHRRRRRARLAELLLPARRPAARLRLDA
jgi:hypothetical protein